MFQAADPFPSHTFLPGNGSAPDGAPLLDRPSAHVLYRCARTDPAAPLLSLDRVLQSRKIIARKLHHPEIPHPFFRGKMGSEHPVFYLSHKLPDGRMSRCLDAQVHSRLCPLDSRCKIRGSYLLSHDFFCFHLYPLHVFIRHFRFQKCLFVSSRLRLLQSTHMQTVTGFLPMLRIPNRQNPPPPRFHTALSVPKVPTCEQLPALLFFPPDRSDTSSGPSFLPKELLFPLFPL